MDEKTTEMVVLPKDPIVRPAVSPQGAIDAWNEYQRLKQQIAQPEDFQKIQGKDFPKKSLWRKMATFFNLSMEVVSEKEIKNEDGSLDFDVVYRAMAPNGRSSMGDGSCNSHEKQKGNSRHNTRSTAHTRAFNRAVSNLIGGGEVSAEEVTDDHYEVPRAPASGKRSNPIPVPLPRDDVPYDPTYLIQLGTYKDTKTQEMRPHWLNGKTIEQAAKLQNNSTHQSLLKDSYDYYTQKSKYRDDGITRFLEQADAWFRLQNEKEAEKQKEVDDEIPF